VIHKHVNVASVVSAQRNVALRAAASKTQPYTASSGGGMLLILNRRQ